jgi:hypothetical protein
MKQFSILSPLWMSFYSKELYREIARSRRGIGLLYLFLLVTLCSLAIAIQFHLGIKKMVSQEFPPIVAQIPSLTIKDGKVATEEARPYRIEDPKNNELIAIIDTTQSEPPTDLGEARIFVTQTEVIVQKSAREKRSFELADIKDFVLTQEKINYWLNALATWGALVAFPFVLIGLFLYRFIQALLFSVVVLIAAKILKVTLAYSAILRLTMIALTPALMINLIFNLLSVEIPFPKLTFIVMVTAYIFFIVNSVKEEPEFSTIDAQPS